MGPISEYVFKNEYKYYDTPDGKDCHKKLWYVTKYATLYGIVGSSLDVIHYSRPKGYFATLARMGYLTGGLVGIGVTFTSMTCMFTNLRGKDDRVNYALAGIAAGAFKGMWLRNVKNGCYSALAFALGGLLLKDSRIDNWEFVHNNDGTREVTHLLLSITKDFSLTNDPAKIKKTVNEI